MAFARRPADFSGFVTVRDGHMVDGAGRPLLLRGMGLGNWMLPEGYMWKLSPGANSPREIEALVDRLVGPEAGARFWRDFQAAFINENDIRLIAESGFDHIRLPINARLVQDEAGNPIEAGFKLIDDCIEWCRTHRLWVLLDLHGAPGGQTGTNIDDSPNNKPELFMDARYREQTITLWQRLARRYRDEKVVLGYDLLNEPIPNEWQHVYPTELVTLYRDLTTAIRQIDTDHLIMYEGTHWATNWDIFTEVWDPNSVFQFHKYWSPPDTPSVQRFIDKGRELGLPIYMGEGGENNLEWLYAAFRLYEGHGIGWNFWPWKKIDTRTSPASIVPPPGWADIVAFANGGPPPPAPQHILDALIEAMRIENCVWQPTIVQAIHGERPSVIPAWGFGFRGRGESYQCADATPMPELRNNDGVTVAMIDGVSAKAVFDHTDGREYAHNERLCVLLKAGDWLEYELTGVADAGRAKAIDSHGRPAAVVITPSARGLRVAASAEVILMKIVVS